MSTLGATLAMRAWLLASAPATAAFAHALRNPERAQRRLLQRFLHAQRSCVFGRAHGVQNARSAEDFRARIPLSDYAALRPDVDGLRAGRGGFARCTDAVTRLLPTSGTAGGGTDGSQKLIPWTAGLARECAAAIAPWVSDLVRRFPSIAQGPAYWAISPPGAGEAQLHASGLPIGLADDRAYTGGLISRVLRGALGAQLFAVPPDDPRLSDPAAWLATTCTHLRACRELRFCSVWHPSFLLRLLDAMAAPRDVRELWPHLAAVSAWADGPAAAPAAALAERIAPVPLFGKGLLATEGVTSIPYAGTHPLALTSHVIEVLGDDDRCRFAWELRPGMRGEIVLTTSGGLWRYRTGDLVEITGLLAATPCLRFLGRRGCVHDLAGEKLDEAQVAAAFARAGLAVAFAALRPLPRAAPPGFALVLAAEDAAAAPALAAAVEHGLSSIHHYALARRLGQLAALRAQIDPRPAAVLLGDLAEQSRARAGTFKPPLLLAADDAR